MGDLDAASPRHQPDRIQEQRLREQINQLQAIRNRLDDPPQINQVRSNLDALLGNERRQLLHVQRRQQEALVSSFDAAWPDRSDMPSSCTIIYDDTKAALAALQLEEDEHADNPVGI